MKNISTLRYLIILLFSAVTLSAASQGFDGVYATINGLIEVRAVYKDSVYRGYSNRLRAHLNYDNASLILNLDLSTLQTGIDSIDKLWKKKLSDKNWQLKGKLSLQYINTKDRKTEKLTMEGYLYNGNGMYKVQGDGELRHVLGDPISCILTLNFRLNLPQLGVDMDNAENLSPDVMVNIQQSILKKE